MKKAIDFFTAKPARFFLLAAFLWFGLMCYLNSKDVGENGFSWHDLLVEANGMVFDLLVFGILLSIYEALREKKEKIERLYEEIDDYRGWDEKEAMFRIVGAVRRLNKLQVSSVLLYNCWLRKAHLQYTDLRGAQLVRADLRGACFEFTDLREANLRHTDLRGASLKGANLEGANLSWADLRGTNFAYGLNNHRITEDKTHLLEMITTNLLETDLLGAQVFKNWFEKIEEWKVEGREEIKNKYFIDEEGMLRLRQVENVTGRNKQPHNI